MKSTHFDLDVLNLLRKHPVGMANYQISEKLKRDPAQTHRKLQKLVRQNVILKIRGYPALYRLDFAKRQPAVFYKVECPKCKTESMISYGQYTKICPNPECLTKTGKPTRFQVTKNRRVTHTVVI